MTKLRNNILYTTLSLLVALFFSACSQEDLADLPNGKLQLAIGQVATDLQTRATPSELGKPVAESSISRCSVAEHLSLPTRVVLLRA